MRAGVSRRGAFLEHAFIQCMPMGGMMPPMTAEGMAEAIKAVGPASCIISSDFGQAINPAPAEGLRMFIARLLTSDIAENDLEQMVKRNPATLLGV